VVQEKEKETTSAKRSKKSVASAESVFLQKLSQEPQDGNCKCTYFWRGSTLTSPPDEEFFTFVKSLSPAAADLEIRSLATSQDLSLFLRALSQRLKSRRDFEAVQTYLNLFLRVHGEQLVSNPKLRADLEAFLSLQRQESGRLLDSIASCLGTLAFVRDTL
jgi:U3 small nucleolar RNA-associated protein 21